MDNKEIEEEMPMTEGCYLTVSMIVSHMCYMLCEATIVGGGGGGPDWFVPPYESSVIPPRHAKISDIGHNLFVCAHVQFHRSTA